MRVVTGRRAADKQAASTNTLSRFETVLLTREENRAGPAASERPGGGTGDGSHPGSG